MEDNCDCKKYEEAFNVTIDFFLKKYGKFIQIKGKSITNKKLFDQMKESYKILKDLISTLKPKGNECISQLSKCFNSHSEDIEEIKNKVNKLDELDQKIEKHFLDIKKTIPESCDEIEENNNIINNINDNEEYYEEEKLTDQEIIENDKQCMLLITNLLEDEEYKRKNKEDKKEIIKLKNQVMDLVKNMELELVRNDEQLDNIENNVERSNELVDKGDKNLKSAAKSAVSRRRLKYQLGLPALLCAVGTVVPGIGNIVGAAVGSAIGYGLYRIDKHRIKTIEKKNKQDN